MNEFVAAAEAVLAQQAAHGWGGEAGGAPLSQPSGGDPHEVLVQALVQLHQRVSSHGEPGLPAWVVDTFGAGLEVAWKDLEPEARLATGLAPRWAALLGEARRLETLNELAEAFGPWLETPAGAALATSLLRQTRRQKHLPLALRLLEVLHAGWRPGRPWAQEYVQVLGFAARQEPPLQAWQLLQACGETLLSALSRPKLDSEMRGLLVRQLVPLARSTLHLEALRLLCRHQVAEGVTSEHLPSLVAMLTILVHFDPSSALGPWVERLSQAHPGEPNVQWLRARWGHQQGTATPQDLIAILEPLLTRERGLDHATRWLAATLFHQGSESSALAWYREAASRSPLPPRHALRLAQLADKLGSGQAGAEASSPESAAPQPGDVPGWAHALRPLTALLNQAQDATAAGLAAASEEVLAQVERSLDEMPPPGLDAALEVARGLVSDADSRLRRSAARVEQDPAATGPGYGTADPHAQQALLALSYRAALAVCEHALSSRPLLESSTPLRSLVELASLLVEHALLLGEAPRALKAVASLQKQLGPLGAGVLGRLEERCHLEEGDLASASDAGRRAGRDPKSQVHAVLPWPEWSAKALRAAQTLVQEPPAEAQFDWVDAQGELTRVTRPLPEVHLAAACLGGVELRNSLACFNADGALLAPAPWRLASGDYPPRMPGLQNRGRRGVTLEAPPDTETVDQPVVVLADMDAVLHRHPYRWNVQILPRIMAAAQAGLLEGRSLLLPSELSSWMRESLSALGVARQTLAYGRQQSLRLADACVVQPMGPRLPAALASAVSDRLVEVARKRGKLAPDAQGRWLYISRQGASSRSLADEEAITRLAASMGFEIVEPERLGALDQVALFASARGVAGALGAGLTHILYAPAGIRVLALARTEECPATYLDLALARQQAWRWLTGPSDARFTALGSSRMPYRIDLGLVERELAWVQEGGASQPAG